MVNNYKKKANKKRNERKKFDYIPRIKPSYMCVKCHNILVDDKASYNDNATAMIKRYCPFCKKNTKFIK